MALTSATENASDGIHPDLQKELEELDDDDDDDDDEDIELSLKQDPQSQTLAALEEQLAAATKELTAIRSEREKQRIQLDQVTKEHVSLQNQKELRLERIKLQEQLDELQGTIDAKALLNRIAQENLEQTKSHHRQLLKTLKLLQGGVEHILEQSTTDPSTTAEGRARAYQRQTLLKDILKQDWKSNQSLFAAHDEIQEDGDGEIRLFHQKNRRYDSIDSMMSEIASISPEDMLFGPSAAISNRATVFRAAKSLTSTSNREGRSRSRSKFYLEEDQQRARSLSRSKASFDGNASTGSVGQRRRSKSGGRKGTLRRTKSLTMPTSPSTGGHTNSISSGSSRRKTSLMRMLDEPHDDDVGSEDTPRTTNTQGSVGR